MYDQKIRLGKELRRAKREKQPMNLTSLIDIMTVLLAVFIVTAPMLTSGLNLELPNGGVSVLSQTESVVISIDKKGNTYISDQKLSNQELAKKLNAMFKENKDVQIVLSADTNVDYGKVISVMGMLKDLGWKKIGLKTKEFVKK